MKQSTQSINTLTANHITFGSPRVEGGERMVSHNCDSVESAHPDSMRMSERSRSTSRARVRPRDDVAGEPIHNRMNNRAYVLAISGSTRPASSSRAILQAVAAIAGERFSVSFFEGLADLPAFVPTDEVERSPERVEHFRERLRTADGILICSPEYVLGVPGALKNAVDWTVGTMDFHQKPVAVITAALSGQRAHHSLVSTLLVLEARIARGAQLVIPFVKARVSPAGVVTDADTAARLQRLTTAFGDVMDGDHAGLLRAPVVTAPFTSDEVWGDDPAA